MVVTACLATPGQGAPISFSFFALVSCFLSFLFFRSSSLGPFRYFCPRLCFLLWFCLPLRVCLLGIALASCSLLFTSPSCFLLCAFFHFLSLFLPSPTAFIFSFVFFFHPCFLRPASGLRLMRISADLRHWLFISNNPLIKFNHWFPLKSRFS